MTKVVPEIKQPLSCSDAELAAFCCFVRRGDEVDPQGLEDRVRRIGLTLVFLWVDGVLVGVGAVKKRDKGYVTDKFRSAGVPKEAADFSMELGWIYVDEQYRGKGYSRVIAAAGVSQANQSSLFATTKAKNKAMQRTLEGLDFSQLGKSWKSQRGHYELLLYVRRV
jgi:RimJ/RimL family protein N-acetyltransferase